MDGSCAVAPGESVCVPCPPGTASVGDFAALNVACDQTLATVHGLWTAMAAMTFTSDVALMALLITMGVRSGMAKGRPAIQVLATSPLLDYSLHLVGSLPALCVGILEVTAAFPGQRSVGVDWATTILYFLSAAAIIMHGALLDVRSVDSLLNLFYRDKPEMRARFTWLSRLATFKCMMELLPYAVLLAAVALPESSPQLYSVFYVLSAVIMLGGSAVALIANYIVLTKLRALIKQVSSSNQSATVLARLSNATAMFERVLRLRMCLRLIPVTAYWFFGLIPWLTRQSTFLLTSFSLLQALLHLLNAAAQVKRSSSAPAETSEEDNKAPSSHAQFADSAGMEAAATSATSLRAEARLLNYGRRRKWKGPQLSVIAGSVDGGSVVSTE